MLNEQTFVRVNDYIAAEFSVYVLEARNVGPPNINVLSTTMLSGLPVYPEAPSAVDKLLLILVGLMITETMKLIVKRN